PFERGVDGQPTLVQNVETLAHLGLIARFGPEWFRELGTRDEPGSMLLTIGGAVTHPGVCEVAIGTPFREAVQLAGSLTQEVGAFLVGGYFGSWVRAGDVWDVPLTNADLGAFGAALGTGVIYAFPKDACGLIASARIADYLANESAGQCGPCLHGLRAIADELALVAQGRHRSTTVDRLHRLFSSVRGRGACRYPDGVARFVASALDVFAGEVAQHDKLGHCVAAQPPVLPIPKSDGSWQ